jgi:hypothetical protein
MDGTRFDAIARALTAVGSRRETVKAMGAAGLGLGLAGLAIENSEARKKRKKRCKKLGQICQPGGKRKCCQGTLCQLREGNNAPDCCLPLNAGCNEAQDCCEGGCIAVLPGQTKRCTVV